GNEDYRLVVDADSISPYMYQATVAIEDRNFYNHIGVDLGALLRATISTLSGKQLTRDRPFPYTARASSEDAGR
ncbi:transglycosylase domain-containing protein, partial [Ralstonia pseudosolanacearum]|uniref:transglycosylase domain-containing protein n=1 Tax=Ralstonia pseudosolanacearum TaxID=1310165 RepID=UPI003CE6DBAE